MSKYSKVSIRTINAFLRKRGIDPSEFAGGTKKKDCVKMTRKEKAKIEEICSRGLKALVHLKREKCVIRDANKKFNFEDKGRARAAIAKKLSMMAAVPSN